MKRRKFILAAALGPAFPSLFAGEKSVSSKNTYYKIVQVDPRLLAKTDDTHPVGWEKKRSDVMGSVYLSFEESAKLKSMLSVALTTSNNIPFCGHNPSYVIVQYTGSKPSNYVSVCGLCMTWCNSSGELRVLNGRDLMAFLVKILPLPEAFSTVKELPDLMKIGTDKSFLELSLNP
jgi:hypothetical protein